MSSRPFLVNLQPDAGASLKGSELSIMKSNRVSNKYKNRQMKWVPPKTKIDRPAIFLEAVV
jgi:hypothetical protein